MTRGRFDAYLLLTLWEGSLAAVAWNNFLDARWLYLAVNVVLIVGVLATVAIMRRRDNARGYLVDRRPEREKPVR